MERLAGHGFGYFGVERRVLLAGSQDRLFQSHRAWEAVRFFPTWAWEISRSTRETLPKRKNGLYLRGRFKPDHPAVLLAFGRLALVKGNREKDKQAASNLFQEAKGFLEKSKSKGEDSATLYSELGEVYAKLNMWDEAAESYKEALRMRRRRNDWRRSLGEAYAKLGKMREAEAKVPRGVGFEP